MITNIHVKDFKAVPYLETSKLMQLHKDGLQLSTDKVNVIVGPNGSGKSALFTALALKTLSFYTGSSNLDRNYLADSHKAQYWSAKSWHAEPEFLPGLTCDTDYAPAVYYRPGHIPGNAPDITHAMMLGYFDQARAYGNTIKDKSSGQQALSLQKDIECMLWRGEPLDHYTQINWGYGTEPTAGTRYSLSEYDQRANIMKATYLAPELQHTTSMVILDEPEQSLDACAELQLWLKLACVDASKLQVVVATHSLYPFMHPEEFHIIESEPGYVDNVNALLRPDLAAIASD